VCLLHVCVCVGERPCGVACRLHRSTVYYCVRGSRIHTVTVRETTCSTHSCCCCWALLMSMMRLHGVSQPPLARWCQIHKTTPPLSSAAFPRAPSSTYNDWSSSAHVHTILARWRASGPQLSPGFLNAASLIIGRRCRREDNIWRRGDGRRVDRFQLRFSDREDIAWLSKLVTSRRHQSEISGWR